MAVSFALILNELISNSLKHAFNGKESGLIKIEALRSGSDLILNYSDNGSWKASQEKDSFGSELINLLTEQISGKFDLIKEEDKTSYKFIFDYSGFEKP